MEKDPETNLLNFELRQFDPRLGRWNGPDPYGQHHSPYLAMGNNPISSVDPSGGTDYYVDGMQVSGMEYNLVAGSGNVDSYSYGNMSYGSELGAKYNDQVYLGANGFDNAYAAQDNAIRSYFINNGGSVGNGMYLMPFNEALFSNYGNAAGGSGVDDYSGYVNAIKLRNAVSNMGIGDVMGSVGRGIGKGYGQGYDDFSNTIAHPINTVSKFINSQANMSNDELDGLGQFSPMYTQQKMQSDGIEAALNSGNFDDAFTPMGRDLFDKTVDAATLIPAGRLAKVLPALEKINQGAIKFSAKMLSKYKFGSNSVTITRNSNPIQQAIKHTRYDMQGAPHGNVKTPHTQSYQWNINPKDPTKFGTRQLPVQSFGWSDIFTLILH